nr:DUF3967 domain-containing protein [Bacillus mycoides]
MGGEEVAKNLGIGSSTLRKYCFALEEAGYSFKRGNNNSRIFYHNDVAIIEHIKTLVERVKRLEQLNLELIQRFDQQSKLLEETNVQQIIREEQRDVQLMQVLREIQDSNRLIAALEQKKLFWSRLFGK